MDPDIGIPVLEFMIILHKDYNGRVFGKELDGIEFDNDAWLKYKEVE